jgi:hypothetical protein
MGHEIVIDWVLKFVTLGLGSRSHFVVIVMTRERRWRRYFQPCRQSTTFFSISYISSFDPAPGGILQTLFLLPALASDDGRSHSEAQGRDSVAGEYG